MYKYQLRGRRRRTTPFPPSNLFHRSPPYQRHASIHQQRISHTHYSRIFPSLQSIHPSMAPAIKCRFSPPLYQRTPLFPTTYYPPMAGAPCHCYAPQPNPSEANLGFHVVRNKHLGLFFLLPLRNQEKRKHPATHHLLILTTDILLLLSLSSFFFFFLFLSFFPRSITTCLYSSVIVIWMHTIWVT